MIKIEIKEEQTLWSIYKTVLIKVKNIMQQTHTDKHPLAFTTSLLFQIVGESSVRTIPEVGTKVFHTFHLINDGPWPAHSLRVNIDWPYQVKTNFVLNLHMTAIIMYKLNI